MKLGTIGFAGALAVICIAVITLAVKVGDEPHIEIPAEALAQAERRHQRLNAAERRRPEPPRASAPVRPKREPRASQANNDRGSDRNRDSDRADNSRSPKREYRPGLSARGRSYSNSNRKANEDPPLVAELRSAYDSGDFESALQSAQEYLKQDPEHPYDRRVATVSACAVGEESIAEGYYAQMSARDQSVMRIRCRRFGFEFATP